MVRFRIKCHQLKLTLSVATYFALTIINTYVLYSLQKYLSSQDIDSEINNNENNEILNNNENNKILNNNENNEILNNNENNKDLIKKRHILILIFIAFIIIYLTHNKLDKNS